MSILVDRDAEMLVELRRYLDTLVIHGDNIGTIRRQLFLPWKSRWNGWVRDETAQRETKAATENDEFPRCSACGAAIWGEHSVDCPNVAPAGGPSRLRALLTDMRRYENAGVAKWLIKEWADRLEALVGPVLVETPEGSQDPS